MDKDNNPVMLVPMGNRTQLQVDASQDIKNAIKILAIQQGVTMQTIVLKGLAKAYPELKKLVDKDLA